MDIKDLTIEQYFAMKREGLADREILEKYFYSPQSQSVMTNWKRKQGLLPLVPKYRGGRVLSNLTLDTYVSYKRNNLSNDKIAKKYGVNPATLDRWIYKQKLTGRLPNRLIIASEWEYLDLSTIE